ncbi:unnamed protein product [Lactuca saligna]|uniref:Uncharacterized protein n=1 Tax=Lactuca saligna TaxID=75948 RepID=A0AA35VAY7_LACSI|nr:unnamed protein product [Lactuca saligna]
MRGRRNSHSMRDLDLDSVVEACREEPAFAPSSCPIDQKKESDARNKRKRHTHAFSDSSVERREKKSKAAAGGSVEEANRKEEDRQKGLREIRRKKTGGDSSSGGGVFDSSFDSKCTRKNQEAVALFGLDVTANHFGGTLAEICEEEKGKKKQFWISDFIIVLQFQSRGCCHLDVHRKW